MKNRLIIFDCFGVIFDEIAPVFFRKYLPDEEAAIIKDKIFVPADLGEITYDEVINLIAEEMHMNRDEVLKEWEGLIKLNAKMPPLIEKLGKTADIALLSNAPLGFVERLFEENDLDKLFDKIFISCNLKMAKPDPEIYRYCVSQFGKNYDEIFMIDDNVKNLEHLPQIGITPVLFCGTESIEDKFSVV